MLISYCPCHSPTVCASLPLSMPLSQSPCLSPTVRASHYPHLYPIVRASLLSAPLLRSPCLSFSTHCPCLSPTVHVPLSYCPCFSPTVRDSLPLSVPLSFCLYLSLAARAFPTVHASLPLSVPLSHCPCLSFTLSVPLSQSPCLSPTVRASLALSVPLSHYPRLYLIVRASLLSAPLPRRPCPSLFTTSLIPRAKFRPPYLGKTTAAAARAVLPFDTNMCSIFVCPNNGIDASCLGY